MTPLKIFAFRHDASPASASALAAASGRLREGSLRHSSLSRQGLHCAKPHTAANPAKFIAEIIKAAPVRSRGKKPNSGES